jgi:hypothetical protein
MQNLKSNKTTADVLKELIESPNEYFELYLNDILTVLKEKDDGGFEDPLKYYFSSKLIEEFNSTHRIYTGDTPDKKESPEKILFSEKYIKPDLVTIEKSNGRVEIFEFKTFVKKTSMYSFTLTKDGTDKSYEKGDYKKQVNRLNLAKIKNIDCSCYLLVFYIDSEKSHPEKWEKIYKEMISDKKIEEVWELDLFKNKLARIKSILIKIL